MTGADEEFSMRAIGIVRHLTRSAATQCERKGITLEDASLGALYGTFDTVARLKGQIGAIEWLRTGLDLIEHQLMEGTRQ